MTGVSAVSVLYRGAVTRGDRPILLVGVVGFVVSLIVGCLHGGPRFRFSCFTGLLINGCCSACQIEVLAAQAVGRVCEVTSCWSWVIGLRVESGVVAGCGLAWELGSVELCVVVPSAVLVLCPFMLLYPRPSYHAVVSSSVVRLRAPRPLLMCPVQQFALGTAGSMCLHPQVA